MRISPKIAISVFGNSGRLPSATANFIVLDASIRPMESFAYTVNVLCSR